MEQTMSTQPMIDKEWWLEGTKACIQANLDRPTRDTFNNIIAHVRTLVSQQENKAYNLGTQDAIDKVEKELPLYTAGVLLDGESYAGRDSRNETLREVRDILTSLKTSLTEQEK